MDGSGAFGPVQSINPANEYGDPVPADLDGDLDLAAPALICSVAGVISGWNDGGSWSWQTDQMWDGVVNHVEIGDIDGDSDSDFAVTSWEFVWSEGPFETTEHSQPYGDGMFLWNFDFVDINGDGDLDALGNRHECHSCAFEVTELAVFENASGTGSLSGGR